MTRATFRFVCDVDHIPEFLWSGSLSTETVSVAIVGASTSGGAYQIPAGGASRQNGVTDITDPPGPFFADSAELARRLRGLYAVLTASWPI